MPAPYRFPGFRLVGENELLSAGDLAWDPRVDLQGAGPAGKVDPLCSHASPLWLIERPDGNITAADYHRPYPDRQIWRAVNDRPPVGLGVAVAKPKERAGGVWTEITGDRKAVLHPGDVFTGNHRDEKEMKVWLGDQITADMIDRRGWTTVGDVLSYYPYPVYIYRRQIDGPGAVRLERWEQGQGKRELVKQRVAFQDYYRPIGQDAPRRWMELAQLPGGIIPGDTLIQMGDRFGDRVMSDEGLEGSAGICVGDIQLAQYHTIADVRANYPGLTIYYYRKDVKDFRALPRAGTGPRKHHRITGCPSFSEPLPLP